MGNSPAAFWFYDVNDFPHDSGLEQQLEVLVGFATLAPSSHNSQPWMFALGIDWVDIIADRRRALPVTDPMDRELAISCGAAVYFFEVAARRFGLQTSIEILPDPEYLDHLVRIHVQPGLPPEPDEMSTFSAIQKRRTDRGDFPTETIPDTVTDACQSLAALRGVNVKQFKTSEDLSSIGALVAEADRRLFGDIRFRRELSAWIHASRSETCDGIPAVAFGMPHLLSPIGNFVVRAFDIGHMVAKVDETRVLTASPVVLSFSTALDDPAAWIETGRALAAVLLYLAAHDLTASYLNQVVQTHELRATFSEMIGDAIPQVLLRVGRGHPGIPPTPRRPVSEVIVT